jgi:hypothetical protein
MTEAQIIDGVCHWPIYVRKGIDDQWSLLGQMINLCPTNSEHTRFNNTHELGRATGFRLHIKTAEMLVRGRTLADVAWGITVR